MLASTFIVHIEISKRSSRRSCTAESERCGITAARLSQPQVAHQQQWRACAHNRPHPHLRSWPLSQAHEKVQQSALPFLLNQIVPLAWSCNYVAVCLPYQYSVLQLCPQARHPQLGYLLFFDLSHNFQKQVRSSWCCVTGDRALTAHLWCMHRHRPAFRLHPSRPRPSGMAATALLPVHLHKSGSRSVLVQVA